MKTVVFIFGRLNPATIGHQKLLEYANAIAKSYNGDFKVYLSKTHKPPKDPLTYDKKIYWFKKSFPQFNKNLVDDDTKNPFQAVFSLIDEGYEEIIMVCGSDRVNEYRNIFDKYTTSDKSKVTDKILYLPKYKVVSLDRDPDSDDVSGMSASKLRGFVKDNNFDEFKKGVSNKLSEPDKKKYFEGVKNGMGV